MLNSVDNKKKFLLNLLINHDADYSLLQNNSQDFNDKNKNIMYDNSTPWNTLLKASKEQQVNISPSAGDNKYGLIFDVPFCAQIFEVAIKKITPALMYEMDIEDEDELIDLIIQYIKNNNLHKKNFYTLIKIVKNLNSDLLQD